MFKKKEEKKNNAASAGIAGAVIGAGIAVATTKALSDKKTRDKIKKTAVALKGKVTKAIEDVRKRNTETKKAVEKKVNEEVKAAKK